MPRSREPKTGCALRCCSGARSFAAMAILGEIVAEIDYGPITRTVTAKPWSDPTADPLGDLKAAQRLVRGACGFAANFIVMGRLAGDAFESNAKVLESYNKLHIQPGVLTARVRAIWRGAAWHVARSQPLRVGRAV